MYVGLCCLPNGKRTIICTENIHDVQQPNIHKYKSSKVAKTVDTSKVKNTEFCIERPSKPCLKLNKKIECPRSLDTKLYFHFPLKNHSLGL